MKNGNGEMKSKNGEYYNGRFFNDKMHGKGERIYINKDKYKGDFMMN